MRIQYRHQKFQADAAKAVVDVFAGQPYRTPAYRMDRDSGYIRQSLTDDVAFTGWGNPGIVPELTDQIILKHLQKIQRSNQIAPSARLEGRESGYNLTIEMETGVGKTYTYIKTIYELNRAYGWSKFIVVVPSIAIREGVYKSFRMTREHFAEEYGKKIRFFIYNSARMMEIERFASDSSIRVMIINSQAFNAKGKDARRIYMKLDELCSRRPIDIIANTNPIMIIDEPQSVEGRQTKENLKRFHPMITLRYSATHKSDSMYNLVYRLDAVEAYRMRLVKKIAVKGITETKSTAADGYLYLEGIHLSKGNPTAVLWFEVKLAGGVLKKKSRIVKQGDNLYDLSNGLEEYRNGFVISRIDGRDDTVEFVNGVRLYAGDVVGAAEEDQIRRIQIRETILSHLQRERQLFCRGIKVLSLFFIDEVANYREYDAAGQPVNGKYAVMFEEEYKDILDNRQTYLGGDDYIQYLQAIPVEKTHAGYFSVDGRGKMINSRLARRETSSDDVSAYELIMKNKELLLEQDPKKSPVRFIFSHSALREGWDNPNVFQICALKRSTSDVRKRQEVGRGLRLSVNQNGERMDINALGRDVHNVNVLTIIAGESYDSFARGLQSEMAEAAADSKAMQPDNARSHHVELRVDNAKLDSREFRALWSKINTKSIYVVDFDTDELIQRSIASLDLKLRVAKKYFRIETGAVDAIGLKGDWEAGESFVKNKSGSYEMPAAGSTIKYDLIGKLVDETGLTRRTVIAILQGIQPTVFEQFKVNPEEFIAKAARLMNDQKAAAIMEHITYNALDEKYGTDIFTAAAIEGRLGVNAMRAEKHLYDYIVYDSSNERDFAADLDTSADVAVYVKLPDEFYISTPIGRCTPDWAIAYHDGSAKHIYFVAETKETMKSTQLKLLEEFKLHCAREHFKAISGDDVVYDVVDSYTSLMERAVALFEEDRMDIKTLCRKLNLENDFSKEILSYDETVNYEEIQSSLDLLFHPPTWEDGVRQLQEYAGEDERGIKILTLYLHGLIKTYEMYRETGIQERIFWDTMGFIPRFVSAFKRAHGYDAFTWADWFPRQIAMCEFRIGEYEYELVEENGAKKIYLHIPEGADLGKGKIDSVYSFVEQFYPAYDEAEIYCDSWLLAPALADLLPESSNIIRFQRQFKVLEVEEDSPAFMDWIYESREIPYDQLPEQTTLQRQVKKHVLSGGKIGWAKGIYIR